MKETDVFRRRIALALLGAAAVSLGLATSMICFAWKSRGSAAKGLLSERVGSIARGDLDTSGPAYAWLQFTSFLQNQQHAAGLAALPGLAVDPDWTAGGNWNSKTDLQLLPGDDNPCNSPAANMQITAGAKVTKSNRPSNPTLEFPIQFRPSKTKLGAAAGSETCVNVVQSVMYNGVASQYITASQLYQMSNRSSTAAVDFPNHSIIFKAVWESVNPMQENTVWDPGHPFGLGGFVSNGLGDVIHSTTWPTQIKIQDNPTSCDQGNIYANGDQGASPTLSPVTGVPISCFWHTDSQRVLVGVNIAHKIDDHWFWFCFAWTNFPIDPSPSQPGYQAVHQRFFGMAPGAPSPWGHYVMNETNVVDDPQGTPTVFNPYLEGTKPNGVVSNCIRCHQFATYVPSNQMHSPSSPTQGKPVWTGTGQEFGASLKPASQTTVAGFQSGTIPTDSLWSIVTGNGQN